MARLLPGLTWSGQRGPRQTQRADDSEMESGRERSIAYGMSCTDMKIRYITRLSRCRFEKLQSRPNTNSVNTAMNRTRYQSSSSPKAASAITLPSDVAAKLRIPPLDRKLTSIV